MNISDPANLAALPIDMLQIKSCFYQVLVKMCLYVHVNGTVRAQANISASFYKDIRLLFCMTFYLIE